MLFSFLNFTGDPLFISIHGKKMSSSMVTGQLNSFWQKSVGGGDRFNATKMRKVSVTKTLRDSCQLFIKCVIARW